MKKHLTTFLAGAAVIAPVAITLYALWWAGSRLDNVGTSAVQTFWPRFHTFSGGGALLMLVLVYLTGLLTRWWLFQAALTRLEQMIVFLPGVKVIYESVRDLMKLFGGGASIGRVVQYKPPGTEVAMLGILTNEKPAGINAKNGQEKVAVFLPFSYMFGGPTIFVAPQDVEDVDMTVEHALKLAATAHLGSKVLAAGQKEK